MEEEKLERSIRKSEIPGLTREEEEAQLAKVIGKPLVFHGQQPEKGGFSGSLTAHQTEHDFKLAARMKCPVDGSQQEQPQGFIGVRVAVGS